MNTSNPRSTRLFTPTVMFMCGGLLIWAANFLIIYVVAAIACARGYANGLIAGVPFVTFVGTVVTLLAAIASAILVRVAVERWRAREDEPSGFLYFLAAAIGVIALLAMFFNVLPAWLLGREC